MKFLYYLFLLVSFSQPLCSLFYVDSLDHGIDQKIEVLAQVSYKFENFVYTINSNIKKQISLDEIEDFLNNEHSIAFFFYDEVQSKIDRLFSDEAILIQESLRDLKFLLGAKLYLYYLECAKQKMFYKAVKNYDALQYWQSEKFYEEQSFYQKSLFRWISRSSYQEKIRNNIEHLQSITEQTNFYLGLVKQNQDILLQSESQQEFEQNLVNVIERQDNFLQIYDQNYEYLDLAMIVKNSIEQFHKFSLDLSAQYAQCQFPSHIERHWQEYTLSTIAVCACVFVYLHYGDKICQGSQHFYKDHVNGPLERVKDSFTGVAKPPQLEVEKNEDLLKSLIHAAAKNPKAMDDTYTILESAVINMENCSDGKFGEGYKDLVHKVNIVDEKLEKAVEIVDIIEKSLLVGDKVLDEYKSIRPIAGVLNWPLYKKFGDVIQKATDEVGQQVKNEWSIADDMRSAISDPSNPYKNLQSLETEKTQRAKIDLASDYSGLSFEQLEKAIFEEDKKILAFPERNIFGWLGANYRMGLREIIDGKNQSNKILSDTHMLFGLTALIPVITIIGGSFFASKKLYNSVAYQPIRTFVRHLEVYLNESFYKPSSFDREGHVYFLTEQLKLNIGVLTTQEQKMIEVDIASLQDHALDYVQKFNVVQRMYRTYPCLIPGAF